jgi:hypothetical protein
MSFRPADLGHHEAILGRRVGQRDGPSEAVVRGVPFLLSSVSRRDLPPPRAPSVFNVLEAGWCAIASNLNRDHIEPDVHIADPMLIKKILGDNFNLTPLLPSYRSLRPPEAVASPCLHLHECDHLSDAHDEVDFTAAETIVGRQHGPTLGL